MKPVFLLLFGAAVASCQPFAVGIKGGVPLTDFINTVSGPNPSIDFGANTNRYMIGPTAELYLPWGFGVEFDAIFRHLNYHQHAELVDLITSDKTTGNAWEFPLLAKYRFPIPGVKPFIDGGVSFDTLEGLKQTITSTPAFGTTTTTTTTHPAELRNTMLYGVTVGGGLEVHLGFMNLLPEVRYTRWGDQHFRDPADLLHWNQNQAEFLLGLTFGGRAR